jgi:hypothetical protein
VAALAAPSQPGQLSTTAWPSIQVRKSLTDARPHPIAALVAGIVVPALLAAVFLVMRRKRRSSQERTGS